MGSQGVGYYRAGSNSYNRFRGNAVAGIRTLYHPAALFSSRSRKGYDTPVEKEVERQK